MASPLAAPIAPIPALGGLQVASVTVPSIDTIGVQSECLLLKNMFDPAAEVGIAYLCEEYFQLCLVLVVSNKYFLSGRRNQILIWISKKTYRKNVLSLEV